MAQDIQHHSLNFKPSLLAHHYGENVRISSSPLMLTLLAKLGMSSTKQPEITHLVKTLYHHLFDEVVDSYFPRKFQSIETRMKEFHPQGVYAGEVIDSDVSCVTVDLARAGTVPSQICFERLNQFMNPDLVRQDHFYVNRECDKDGKVIGVNVSGSKIGGKVQDSMVLLPDPMGATGGTIAHVYDHYMNKLGGKPKMIMAIHLIVTPEYLRRMKKDCPDLNIFALRLDRGLSSEKVLKEVPGKFWDEEIGLNEHQYIVPGAGGLGEILNNAYC